MGCGSSTHVIDLNQLNKRLTDQQIGLVKETWPLMATDLQGCGMCMFTKLFELHPDFKPLFLGLGDLKPESNTLSPGSQRKLEAHALRVMQALEMAVNALSDSQQLTQILRHLGSRHSSYNVLPIFLPDLWPAVDHMLKQKMPYGYSGDVKDAWRKVFEFLIGKMIEGMKDNTTSKIQQ